MRRQRHGAVQQAVPAKIAPPHLIRAAHAVSTHTSAALARPLRPVVEGGLPAWAQCGLCSLNVGGMAGLQAGEEAPPATLYVLLEARHVQGGL